MNLPLLNIHGLDTCPSGNRETFIGFSTTFLLGNTNRISILRMRNKLKIERFTSTVNIQNE